MAHEMDMHTCADCSWIRGDEKADPIAEPEDVIRKFCIIYGQADNWPTWSEFSEDIITYMSLYADREWEEYLYELVEALSRRYRTAIHGERGEGQ